MKKEDRRVRYTKQLLRDALVELLAEYHISKISVTMLCEQADVNRGTFYLHYSDPLDLLRQTEQAVYRDLEAHLAQPNSQQSNTERILDYAARNADLFRVLLGDNGTRQFSEDMMRLAQQTSEPAQISLAQRDERLYAYVNRFSVTSCISVLKKWLDDGMPESTAYMAGLVMQLLHKGIDSV